MGDVTRREAVVVAAGVAGAVVLAGEGSAAAQGKVEKPGRHEGSEFILKLSGIKLPPEAEKRIAAELQSTLLRELAHTDLKAGLAVRIPNRDWFGIWIERALKPADIPTLRVTEGGVKGG